MNAALRNALIVALLVTCSSFSPGARPSRRVRRAKAVMSWSDPDWNWGSPFGKAHDCAALLRTKLSTVGAREGWVEAAVAGEVDLDEMKLALALRIQHARRAGTDGNGVGWRLMSAMAQCKYEGADGISALSEDALKLCEALGLEGDGQGRDMPVAGRIARALVGMDFVEEGL